MSQALDKVSENVSATQLTRLAQMTGFQKMVLLNDLAGNHTNGGWEAADAQFKLIASEFEELRDKGIAARNIDEVRDGIADLLVTVYGLAHRMGINADADLHEVVLSNLTKFDPSNFSIELVNDTAIRATVGKYLRLGVETVQLEVDDPLRDEGTERKLLVTKSAYDQHGNDGKSYPAGKWLKSAGFVEPEFPPLPLRVQDKLGLIQVHRGLGTYAFGTYLEPGDGGYYARALETFTPSLNMDTVVTVNEGDYIFVPNSSAAVVDLPTPTMAAAMIQTLDALPDPANEPALECLFGSDAFPSHIAMDDGTGMVLGDLVRASFVESGLTIAAWNNLPVQERDQRLSDTLSQLQPSVAMRD